MRDSTFLPIDTFLPCMRDVVRCEQSLHPESCSCEDAAALMGEAA